MAMLHTLIESKNECFKQQIVEIKKFKILGVADYWGKTIFTLNDPVEHKKFWWNCMNLHYGCVL